MSRNAALTMVVLVAVGATSTMLNEFFGVEALRISTGQVDMTSLGSAGSDSLVLLLDAQHFGIRIVAILMGLWLVPLGYLAYRSGWFPKALAALLVMSAGCYLVGTLAAFLLPDAGLRINTLVTIPCGVAAIWMVVAPLVLGLRTPKPVPAPDRTHRELALATRA